MAQQKRRNLVVVLVVVILVIAIALSSFVYLSAQKPYTGSTEPITIGIYPSE